MRKKILIIDDYEALLNEVSEMLSLEGYRVYTATNGYEGIQKAVKYIPDIIICDISMPDINGYEVYRTLEKIPDTSLIPFVFLTAKATTQDFRNGLSIGADDYLTKPFKIEELLSTINKRVSKIEKIYKASNYKFEGVANNPFTGIFVYSNTFLFVNKTFTDITGYNLKSINEIKWKNLLKDNNEETLKLINACFNGFKQFINTEVKIKNSNNEIILLKTSMRQYIVNNKIVIIGSIINNDATNKANISLDRYDKIQDIFKYFKDKNVDLIEEILNIKKEKELDRENKINKLGLTKREIEVLGYICLGYTNKEIADKLFLSKRTIDRHRTNIYIKTNTNNTAKLINFAIKNNLVDIT